MYIVLRNKEKIIIESSRNKTTVSSDEFGNITIGRILQK